MISLNKYITESLLDDLEDLENDSDNAIKNTLIEKFLNENYSFSVNIQSKMASLTSMAR